MNVNKRGRKPKKINNDTKLTVTDIKKKGRKTTNKIVNIGDIDDIENISYNNNIELDTNCIIYLPLNNNDINNIQNKYKNSDSTFNL
jgi:hypothetical protein